jgi:hypothetical protein
MTSEAVADILIAGLPLVTAGTVYILTAAGVYLTAKYRDNKIAQALAVLDQIVIDVVKELNQTVVGDLKKARSDGKLTPDEAAQIKSKAVDLVMKRIGAGIPRILQKVFGSLLALISTKVEATVYDLKQNRKVA